MKHVFCLWGIVLSYVAGACYKTKMCPFKQEGECAKGNSCTFAHSPSEIQELPDLTKTKLCNAFMRTGQCPRMGECHYAHGHHELKRINTLKKTSLCINFKNGSCQHGDNCRYAHGDAELRPMPKLFTGKKTEKYDRRQPHVRTNSILET